MLSVLATHTTDGFVPGINDIIKGGYIQSDGTKAIPLQEKITRGKRAINALSDYRSAKKEGDSNAMYRNLNILKADMPFFGYGYIKDSSEIVPYIPICFYAFRVMVGLGVYFVLMFAVILFFAYRKDITKTKWLQYVALWSLPLIYIVSESGWLVSEFGRQPWTIQDMLPTCAAISDINSSSVIITFFVFLILFTTLLTVEINILCHAIKKGPEKGEYLKD